MIINSFNNTTRINYSKIKSGISQPFGKASTVLNGETTPRELPSYGFNPVCISFGALKKSAFKATDLAVVNKFKAPIEKFNSNEDFQNWCKEKRNKEYNLPVFGFAKEADAGFKRTNMLEEWQNYLDEGDHGFTEAQKLLIAEGVASDMDSNTCIMPVHLDKEALKETMKNSDAKYAADKALMINFKKEYTDTLKKPYLKDMIPDKRRKNSGWIVIPQTKLASPDLEKNANKLRLFSADTWCTKSNKAESYILKNSFHIYLDNGKPVMAVRIEDGLVSEIQNVKNNSDVDAKYIPSLQDYIGDREFDFETGLQYRCYLQTKT